MATIEWEIRICAVYGVHKSSMLLNDRLPRLIPIIQLLTFSLIQRASTRSNNVDLRDNNLVECGNVCCALVNARTVTNT